MGGMGLARAGRSSRWLGVLLGIGLLAGCSGSSSTRTSPPPTARTLTIYSDLPMRTPELTETQAMVQAIRLVLDDSQDAVGDFRIRYVDRDDASPATGRWDPALCRANAQSYAADPSAVGVIGTYDSGCTEVELPILNRAGIVMVSPVNTYDGLTQAAGPGEPARFYPTGRRTLARLAAPDSVQAGAAVKLAQQDDAKKLFVVSDGRPWGEALADRVVRIAVAQGLPVARRTRVVAARPEHAPCVVRRRDRELWRTIRASGADAVFFAGTMGDDPASFWCAERPVLGDAADDVHLIGADALYQDGFLVGAGRAAEGTSVLFGAVPPDQLAGKGADFVDEYTKRFGQPQTYTAYAAEAAGVLLAAIARSDGTRASVADEVMHTRFYNGLLGRWSLDPNGDTDLRRYAVMTVGGGRFGFDRVLGLP
jgi:branched-chain amino acid transport system substrate-binding protein